MFHEYDLWYVPFLQLGAIVAVAQRYACACGAPRKRSRVTHMCR